MEDLLAQLEHELRNRPRWQKVYYGVWRLWDRVKRLPRRIRWRHQRAHRGWSDRDLWGFSHYLARVLAEGLEEMARVAYGYPHGICTTCDPTLLEHEDGCDGLDQWIKILHEMADGFRAHQGPFDQHDFEGDQPYVQETREAYEARKAKRDKALDLLREHFDSLWA